MVQPCLRGNVAVSTLLVFKLALSPEPAAAQSVSDGAAFTERVIRTARPLPDRDTGALETNGRDWITQLVRDARVLGIGESAHDVMIVSLLTVDQLDPSW